MNEVLIDIINYLLNKPTARELTRKMVLGVLKTTGITTTADVGTNSYLAKVALDLWVKHTKPDKNGVHIAELDEMSYRKLLWEHRHLTDFWRVGREYAKSRRFRGCLTWEISPGTPSEILLITTTWICSTGCSVFPRASPLKSQI